MLLLVRRCPIAVGLVVEVAIAGEPTPAEPGSAPHGLLRHVRLDHLVALEVGRSDGLEHGVGLFGPIGAIIALPASTEPKATAGCSAIVLAVMRGAAR